MKQDPVPQPAGSLPSSFFARRWACAYPLGRPLSVGLLLTLLALVLFAVIAVCVVQPSSGLGQFDRALDEDLRRPDIMTPAGEKVFKAVSDLGSRAAVIAIAIALALLLFVRLWWVIVLGVLFAILVEPVLEVRLKDAFQQPRPRLPHPAETKKDPKKPPTPEVSDGFPSGHCMGSMAGYGMLGYVVLLWSLPRRWLRVTAVMVLTLLVLLVGFSRLYLHAHYFSQALGGFAAGGFWLSLCITLTEVVRRGTAEAVISNQ